MRISAFLCFAVLLVFAFVLSGCGQIAPFYPASPTPAPVVQATATGIAIPVTGGYGAPVTGDSPQVMVNDQTYDGTNVVVAKVISKGPGWMAIHNQQDGHIGPVIGYTHVDDGENNSVVIKVDPAQATPIMYAMLHVDAGVVGKYEFPGPDVPVMIDGQMVSPAFKATVGQASDMLPSVTIHDQDVSGGKVVVDQVMSSGPGWIAIHAQNKNGAPGIEIGYSAVKMGTNTNVVVTIDASKASPVLYAMLHTDAGEIGIYEYPGPDLPVLVNGEMVAPTFKTTGPGMAANITPTAQVTSSMEMGATPIAAAAPANVTPAPTTAPVVAPTAPSGDMGMVMATPAPGVGPNVKVSDQTIQNGMVKVDDVISNGPGWIVIYSVTNGQPDQPIGHAPVHDGDNQNVMVQIDPSKATDTLYAQLHADAGQVGVFEFPGPDAPLMLGVKMISGQFKNLAAATASASPTLPPPEPVITVHDQPIHNGTIVISQVVSVGDAWLVVHPRNPDGSTGDYIGYAQVHDGVNNNVLVKINTRRATPVLYGMLHVNASKASAPQFPGVDNPVMVRGQMLLPAFRITGPLTGDTPLTIAKNSSGTPYLADGWGTSLYLYLNDTPGKSNCIGDCLTKFHPLLAAGTIAPGNGVSVDKLGVIILPDGTRQVTYSGAPLYYAADDKKPGDTLGQGMNGLWFLVTP